MKIKLFIIAFITIIVLLILAACDVENPLPDLSEFTSEQYNYSLQSADNSSVHSNIQNDSIDESSEKTESPEESSVEASSEIASEEPSSEEPSVESSEEPSQQDESSEPAPVVSGTRETFDIDPRMPYQNLYNLTYSNLPKDSELDSYFNDSVFIGDSVMVLYSVFHKNQRIYNDQAFMGTSSIFAVSCYSALHDSKEVNANSWHPKLNGVKMKAADAVANLGVKTVYLSQMALNEIGLRSTSKGVEETFNSMLTMMNEIWEKSPNVKIVILSNTYLAKGFNSSALRLNNRSISLYNNMMLDYCNKNGIDYIDYSSPLVVDGHLADEFCVDANEKGDGCHPTQNSYAIWTAVLRNYAYAKLNNFYTNPASMPIYNAY